MPRTFAAACLLLLLVTGCRAPAPDSGGPLSPAQAAYEVTFYDLEVAVDPAARRIDGRLTAHLQVVDTLDALVLDLDQRLAVDSAVWIGPEGQRASAGFRHRGGMLTIPHRSVAVPGERLIAEVSYGGRPREAPNPPWDGGFIWAETPDGTPWIATANQMEGADLWWPVKDHPSDRPDSMAIQVSVPAPLVVASNGSLREVRGEGDRRRYSWFVSTPINAYNVALNIAPYATVDTTYTSVDETEIPVTIWALPGDTLAAREALPEYLDQLSFLEETLGPYPFRQDKYGIVQVPYSGMEHQTIIAHGGPLGQEGGLGYEAEFDALHLHELAHEWFGNHLTARDWKDLWLHEGFATYMEALYAEARGGEAAYRALIEHFEQEQEGGAQIARREASTMREVYHRDVYYRGALALDALRSRLGDEVFFRLLRDWVTAGGTFAKTPYLVQTNDFIARAEALSGQPLQAFAERYLYDDVLPVAHTGK